MKERTKFITRSANETLALGERFAALVDGGDLIALIGDLGCGKTIFVKGLAKGLGVERYNYVNSPSFVVVKEYEGKVPLYHFDVYRFCSKLFCETMDPEKYFYSQGVTVVEWADKIVEVLPDEYVEVRISYGTGDERGINFRAVGKRPEYIVGEFLKKDRR